MNEESPEFIHPPERVTEVIGKAETGMKLKVKRARLKVVKGPDKGQEKAVPLHGLIVGKGPTCNFVLHDPAVSSEHFRLVPTEKGFLVEDLGSSNGTWVEKVRLGTGLISNKEKVSVGYTALRLEVLSDYEEFPLSRNSSFGQMMGHSVAMRQAFAILERAASSDATLLLEGETGTGKDLAAENVHALSSRAKKPFVVVDCSGMQANLVESHLFGHVKGAFTDAESDHVGAFEAAQGGTIFLDELGELSPTLQPKLLRVLEKRQVQRIGENNYRPVDVRLIAATNRHLDAEMEAGRFREDLFYRLSVLRVSLPALRDRRDDIPLLASSMVRSLDPNMNPSELLSDNVLTMLAHHDWPGNVRELRNVIERLLLFPEWPERVIDTFAEEEHSASGIDPNELPFLEARDLVLDRFEKSYIVSNLSACDGRVGNAAKKAKTSRQTFHRLMNKHGIHKAAFRA
ncbi:MAG: sigma 54-interacting transcriptional regulator [Myxococcota bacterium]|jgi:DNA-binding NtrC family response regulator|nr:sigma 54-interacting transcriptional regulator [Myxococcota bacterium]